MRTTTSIKAYCRMCKADTNGQAPIEIAITINGSRKFFTTNLKCDGKTFKTKPPQYATKFIESLKLNLSQTMAEMAAQGIPITAERIRAAIQKGGINSYTIRDLFNDYNKILKLKLKAKTISERSVSRYYYIEDLFSKEISTDRETTDITPAVIQTFYAKLQGKYQESSLAGMMTKLKTICKYAIDNNHLQINPFQNIKIKKGLKEITTITKEELDKIREKKFLPRLQKVADMFIFSCGSGISYCDCCALKKEDFQEKDGKLCIFKNRQKTNIPFYSVLLPWGKEIAEKYNYDFKELKISNQKINAYLKEIADLCGITLPSLHFHLARHFYATYLINHSVPISSISKALGHSGNSQVTAHYSRLLSSTIVQDIGAVI